MNELVGGLVAERRAALEGPAGDTVDTSDLLGRMLTGVDKQTGEKLPDENIRAQCITFLVAGHETTSGLLSFAIYYLIKNPASRGPGPRRGRRRSRRHRCADLRAGATADLRAAGARREPAAVADRARLHPRPLRGHRDRRPVRHPGGHPDDHPQSRPCTTAPRSGDPMPPSSTPITWPRSGSPRCPRTPTSRSARVSGRASDGSSPCRRRCWCSACCCSGSSSSTTSTTSSRRRPTLTVKPDDFHIQVRPRQGVRIERGAPADGQTAAVAPATVPDAAPAPQVARHGTPLSVLFGSNLGTAEAIATRLAAGGHRAGLRRHPRRTRRPRRRPAAPTALPSSCARRTTARRRTTPPPSAGGSPGRTPTRPRGGLHRLRLRQHGVGRDLPGRADPARHPARGPRRASRPRPRGEGNAAGDFDAAYRDWHNGLWTDLARALDLPAEVAADVPTGPRLSITLDQPAGHQPGDRLLPGAAGASCGPTSS